MSAFTDLYQAARHRAQDRLIRLAAQRNPPSPAHQEAARNLVRTLMAQPHIMDTLTHMHRRGMDPEGLWQEIQGAILGDPFSAQAARGLLGGQGDRSLREGLEQAGDEGMGMLQRPTRDARVAAFGDINHPEVHDMLAHLWGLPTIPPGQRTQSHATGPSRSQHLQELMRVLHNVSPQDVRQFLPALHAPRLHTGHPESVLGLVPGLADLSQRTHLTEGTPRSQVPFLTRDALVHHLGPMVKDIHTALSQREESRRKMATSNNLAGDQPDPEALT